jgi:hypothetical protein
MKSTPTSHGSDFASSQPSQSTQPAIDAAAELRRRLDDEIARLCRLHAIAPEQQKGWIERRLNELFAMRDAGAETAEPENSAEVSEPDLDTVPAYLRDIVQEHLVRKAAERAEAKRQAAEEIRLAHEEAVTAQRRAALSAPQMGHLANVASFKRGQDPQRLTRTVSTPEQRQVAAMRHSRAEEARIATATMRYVRPAPENAAPIPCCDLRPPAIKSTPWDLTAAMP